MSSFSDDGSAADRDRDGLPAGDASPTATGDAATGDLEFDEAWGGAAAGADAVPGRGPRDPDPSFEDPNDR
jgi:hypothetical protein